MPIEPRTQTLRGATRRALHCAAAATLALSFVAVKATASSPSLRVGMVDGGLDTRHPALRDADVRSWGCGGASVPSSHGTAVGSLLVGQVGPFRGAALTATLCAADIYCAQSTGGMAETIAQALAWMAREQVAVINVSVVGPPNRLLERAVRALAARGHVVVAAVGNDGPQAPPLYPASYPDVVGVTAVGVSRRVLPEAARGPQVFFAALGAEMAVAAERGFDSARGTSFAAPIVAGLLAGTLRTPNPAAAVRAIAELASTATDLGAPGRDDTYGWGLLGEALRVSPDRMQAFARDAR
jgi:subtilisin family serine protease